MPGTMSFKVTIDGVTIECGSAAEAIELARLASNGRPSRDPARPRRGPGRPPKNGRSTINENREKHGVSSTLLFLRTVKDAGKLGADMNAIMMALGLKHGRAIGGVIVRARSIMGKEGINPDKVYRTIGRPGAKRWRARPEIGDAIARLENPQNGGG